MKRFLAAISGLAFCTVLFINCTNTSSSKAEEKETVAATNTKYGGYETAEKYGEHLVLICGCNDCHTPKKMTPNGPEPDMALMLSGHPAAMPAPDVARNEVERKGLAVTNDLTAWVGPWGISFSANLTSDTTGTGNWTFEQFTRAMREGKSKGLPSARTLLPPMPWQMYRNMTDDELSAIFAFLKSTKPINNMVPAPQPPMAMAGK